MRSLFSISLLLLLAVSALARDKKITALQARNMIAHNSWQLGMRYTLIISNDVSTLPALTSDRSYLKKVLERNGWHYTDWGSGNGSDGPRRTDMEFEKAGVVCKLARIYKYIGKAHHGYKHMQLREELEFNKK